MSYMYSSCVMLMHNLDDLALYAPMYARGSVVVVCFKSCLKLLSLLVLSSWAHYFTSLGLSFFLYRMSIVIVPTLLGCCDTFSTTHDKE